LLVFNFSKDIYYCYDPDGRLVLVKGKASLKKIDVPGRPAKIKEAVKVGLDVVLKADNNVWLVGYNSTDNTAQVLLQDGTKVSIPTSKIDDLKEVFDYISKLLTEWHSVE